MSASGKFDLSSGSPDRPLYSAGQRGSYTAASLDRSGSFRENMENTSISSLPNMTRSSSAATQGDVVNFLQCLRFDPKSMVADHKLNRPVDFRRLTSAAFGIPLEDSPPASSKGRVQPSPSPEELRRLKAGLRESCSRARERMKIFSESLSVINKYFPSIPSRKRSRLDVLSTDRSNALFPADRAGSGPGLGKMGSQSHGNASGFDVEQQKLEERTKGVVPNKRTRTSMVDPRGEIRANTPARASANMDRDKEMSRLPNTGTVQSEDRTSSIGVDGWEKSRMKKKRSGIKADVTGSLAAAKPIDGQREPKQGIPPRVLPDARSRPSDPHGFRPVVAVGGVGMGKVDGPSQQTGLSMRSSLSRTDPESSPLLHDRRDRPNGPEKERINLKAMNNATRANPREDLSSGSPTSSTKLSTGARGPRSGSIVPKLPPAVQRTTAANDWELSHCTNKLQAAGGANNRKRTSSTRSSSPPVAHWATQRQKISRPARRTNFVPIIPSSDETPGLDTSTDVGPSERRFHGNSPQQVKLKSDHFSSAASESEESGPAEIKSRDKSKRSDDVDDKSAQNVQKMSSLPLPPRKNKPVTGEDHGDGVRRQGRSGRGFTSTRSLVPLAVEKLGNVGTAKQLRSSRLGFDKTERAGRPPSRKLSDRKAYKRQKHSTIGSAAVFLVGSDDGRKELLEAANAVTDTAQSLSSSFWKQMESLFRYISDLDITYLKEQMSLGNSVMKSAPMPLDTDNTSLLLNGFRLDEHGTDGRETKNFEFSPEYLSSGTKAPSEISLYQRLLAALIPEGDEELSVEGNEDLKSNIYGSGFEVRKDMHSNACHQGLLGSCELPRHPASNGHRINANRSSFDELNSLAIDNNDLSVSDMLIIRNCDHLQNGLLPDQVMLHGTCSEDEYSHMSINERLLLEIHCIGIFPESVPDIAPSRNEEISADITVLDEKYQELALKKKGLLAKVLNTASETRKLQEKEFEERALDKLVVMAYEKYMSASGKMAKQAALTSVKHTVARCQEFEETGKSCFNEPVYKDMFLSGLSLISDGQPADSSANGESSRLQGSTSGCSAEVRNSAPLGAQRSPSLNNHEIYSSEALLSGNLASDQSTGKEETWSSRFKQRELLLEDVGGGIVSSSGAPSGIGNSLSSSVKGKRSERDREGKGNNREALSRNGTTKIGRAASTNAKGERKSKAKPKQKMTQLSASVNGLLGKMSEQPKTTLPSKAKSTEMNVSGNVNDKNDYRLDELEEPIDLSGLQLPGIDVLGVGDDLDGQGQDIGSWLNIDDDGLQDHDFMGLEIPMDDLSDLNMMV